MHRSRNLIILLIGALSALAVVSVSLSICTGSQNAVSASNLGNLFYSLKTLDGMFFSKNDSLFLISGTEVLSGNSNQVFIYDVTHDNLIVEKKLQNSTSMTAFCQTDDLVYFAGISETPSTGCDLYAWSPSSNEISHCAHFPEKGIYALTWNGGSKLFIGTSYPANIYGYDMISGDVDSICVSPTEKNFIRSMSAGGGHLYLGVGTDADFIEVDPASGQFRSLLDNSQYDASFVYAQISCQDIIILLLSSPSHKILEYDINSGRFIDTGLYYRQGASVMEGSVWVSRFKSCSFLNLLGELLVLENGTIVSQISSLDFQCAYWDEREGAVHGFTQNGIYQKIIGGKIVFQRDFCDSLEKNYVIPTEFLAYNDILYIPDRRFWIFDLTSREKHTFFAEGEPQASTVTPDGVYTANYTLCTVYFYPFDVLTQDQTNVDLDQSEQFLLADIENQCRPSQMTVTPDGKYLVIVSGPLYGHFGGAVSVYDLDKESLLYTHINVVENHRIQAVGVSAKFPEAVWLGSAPYGENTSPTYLKEPPHLILWNLENEVILLDIIPDKAAARISSILELNGIVCCLSSSHVTAYDAVSGRLLAENTEDSLTMLLLTSGGRLLGISDTTLFAVDPQTLKTEVLIDGFSKLRKVTEDPITGVLYGFNDTELVKIEGIA